MGKIRRNKFRYIAASRGNLSGIGNFEMDTEETAAAGDGPIEAIRDQLQSHNIEEKLNSLQSLAVLTANKDKVLCMCKTDIVRIAAPLLCEKNDSVRNAAAGALRNMSVCGMEVCEYLVEQDILTPLLALVTEYALDNEWRPTFDVEMLGQMDLHSDIFFQAVNLLWNLCESTPVAIDAFNQANLIPLLIRCLDYKIFGVDIAISVAQTLLVITEENPKSWIIINDNIASFLNLLNTQGDFTVFYLRSMAAGILANVPALAASYGKSIIQSLSLVMDENHINALASLLNLPARNIKTQTPELEVKIDAIDDETEEAAAKRRRLQELPNKFDIAVRGVGYLLDAQRLAAEVITNLCVNDDDEKEQDFEEEVKDENTLKNKADNDNKGDRCEVVDQYYSDTDKISLDLAEAIKQLRIVDKLWKLSQSLDTNLTHQIRDVDITLLIKVKNLRISSLLCLQNLCNCLDDEDLGGKEGIYNVWVDLGQQIFRSPRDGLILEPLTSLMRSTLEHLKSNRELFQQLTQSDLELMLDGVKNCSLPEIRANWLRMLGTLGCLLPENLVKLIITVILETCLKESDVWTISEALDSLMDIFEDNDWPQIVADLRLPLALKQLQMIFKNKIRSQRKELKERYAAVDTVAMNLARFIVYLESNQ